MIGVATWLLAAELHWSAPPGCPSQDEVRARLRRLLGPESVEAGVSADARVHAHDRRWSLHLTLRTAEHATQRRMSADDCRTLADAAALVVATFAEPLSIPTHLGPPRAPSSSRQLDEPTPDSLEPVLIDPPPRDETPAPPDAPTITGPNDPGRPMRPRAWEGRWGVLAGRAAQPDLDLGLTATLARHWGAVHLVAGAVGMLPRSLPVPERDAVTLRRWMIAGRLMGGLTLPVTRRLEVPLALGLEVGPVVARGRGVDLPRTAISPWLAMVTSVHVVWQSESRWGLWAGAEGLMAMLRPQFTVDGALATTPGPSGLRALAGVHVRITR